MAKNSFHQSLISSDEFAQYSLRATFFVRKLRALGLWDAIHEVNGLTRVREGFAWDKRRAWGIEEDAWTAIAERGMDPLLVFCHPRVLKEQPKLLMYYRNVTLISQKGLATLIGGNIAGIESGKVVSVENTWAENAVVALNSLASAIVKNSSEFEVRDLPGFQFATAGATIQGSWNNAIGAEGEAAVRTILVNHLANVLVQVVWKDGSSIDYSSDSRAKILDRVDEIRILRLRDGFHLVFGSEPDISMRDREDTPVIAVEIKAGADPAGALERLGAAMKSFESDREQNPDIKSVYVVRCLTPELQNRINQGRIFDHIFALSDLLVDSKRQKAFANLFARFLGKANRKA